MELKDKFWAEYVIALRIRSRPRGQLVVMFRPDRNNMAKCMRTRLQTKTQETTIIQHIWLSITRTIISMGLTDHIRCLDELSPLLSLLFLFSYPQLDLRIICTYTTHTREGKRNICLHEILPAPTVRFSFFFFLSLPLFSKDFTFRFS